MKITADTTSYRPTVTDPVTKKKTRFSFPLHGTIKEKREQIKTIDLRIRNLKLEIRMMELKDILLGMEANRRNKHQKEASFIANIASIKEKKYKQPISELFEKYQNTDHAKKIKATGLYQRKINFERFKDFLESKNIVDVVQINPAVTEEFLNSMKCKAATFNKYKTNISGIFKALNLDNPFENISYKNEEADVTTKKPFTEEEVKTIIDNYDGEWKDICIVAANTGMRFSDVVHLNKFNIIPSVDKKGYVIKVTPGKTQHTGRSIYIQLTKPLEFLLNNSTDSKGFFFPDKVYKYKGGTSRAGSSLNHVFMKKLKSLGITGKSFHCFRHYFVDKLRKAGLTNEQIGSIVGHSSITQTRDYGDYHAPIDLNKSLFSQK